MPPLHSPLIKLLTLCLLGPLSVAQGRSCQFGPDPSVDRMSLADNSTIGLAITHNRLQVHHPQQLVDFYKDKFGMKLLGTMEGMQKKFYYLGFADGEGVLWNPIKTYLELVFDPSLPEEERQPYKSSKDDIYWKVGVSTRDVDEAAGRLRTMGLNVANGTRVPNVGYVSHLRDPDGFTIELLQHDFQANFVPSPASSSLPLGFPLALGQVTLRVSNADASLRFYQDILGMKLLLRLPVKCHDGARSVLYFLAWTDAQPPNPDVNAVENAEWLWRQPFTTIELQHMVSPPLQAGFQEIPTGGAGFLGLRAFSPRVADLKKHLEHHGYATEDFSSDDPVMGLPSFVVRDPDGIPITVNQIAL